MRELAAGEREEGEKAEAVIPVDKFYLSSFTPVQFLIPIVFDTLAWIYLDALYLYRTQKKPSKKKTALQLNEENEKFLDSSVVQVICPGPFGFSSLFGFCVMILLFYFFVLGAVWNVKWCLDMERKRKKKRKRDLFLPM